MDKTVRKDKKSGPSSRSWFGKSWTMRLPRSKSREKLRMVLSKSSDRIDRKPTDSSTDCEGPSCDQTFDFTSRFCTECEMRQCCSRLCDKKLDRNPRSFCFINDMSEKFLCKTVAEKVSSENVECTGSEHFNLDSCLKRGSELGPDRKEPSAPVLNDDSMYTSRQEWLTMAKAHRSSLKEKIQEEFLSCKICLEPFLRPKGLPCFHTFCEHCLKDYVRRHPGIRPGHFPCPMCRKDTRIPDGGIENLQDNFLLLSLSDTLEEDDVWQYPGQQLSPPRCIAPPTPLEQKLRENEWYFGKVSRNASEEWLLSTGYPKGSFLIRQGEASPDTFTLSVRDCDELRGYIVKHYKIHAKRYDHPFKDYYCITPKRTFKTLQELVDHYSECADGLCCKLTEVCGKPRSLSWALERGKEDEFSIPRDSLNLVKRIGGGQFADVWMGKWNHRDVAIKMQRPDTVKMAAFLDEAQILKTLDHPNIVQLLAVCSSSEPVYLVTEYMENGRLSLYLREGEGSELKLSQLIWLGAQIADGLAYMEKEKFIHRNLGARNILVGEKNKVKIAGFGMTKCADDPDFNFRRGLKMAIKWMSPEVLLYNKYGTKADVWSFGILMTEIFTYGKEPYEGMGSKEAFENVQHGYRMPRPELCPEEIFDVILTCWSTNPPSRPSFDFLNTFFHDWRSPS